MTEDVGLPAEEITETEFLQFQEVRESGEYNMVTDSHQARKEMGVGREVYWGVLKNYGVLKDKFG